MSCPVCGKQKESTSALVQHTRRQHELSNKEVYVLIHGPPPACVCGNQTSFVSINSGFETKCSVCLKENCEKSIKGSKISAALMGHSNITDDGKRRIAESRKGKPTTTGLPAWNKGLTKFDHPSLMKVSEKTSTTLKTRYANLETPCWIAGLTKDTDERVGSISKSLKAGFLSGRLKSWSTGLTKETNEVVAAISRKKQLTQDEVTKRCSEFGFSLLSEYSNQLHTLETQCNKCQTVSNRSFASIVQSGGRCKVCVPTASKWQLEIMSYVAGLGVSAIIDDRRTISPLELDISIPSHSFSIECNGLYWHSQDYTHHWMHQYKTDLTRKLGIKLMHLFEDEWRNKSEIIKSMIKSRLGKTTHVYARSLTVSKVSQTESAAFFAHNHIDGSVKSSVTIGLRDRKGTLLLAMSLRRPHQKKWKDYVEVARFATLQGHTVVGGLSRLSTHSLKLEILKEKSGLMSYMDTRHGGDGSSYINSGWQHFGETGVRFWWTDYDSRFDRFKFRARDGLTEKEVAKLAKVKKIHGCKNLVFVYNNKDIT